jgi:hypothetical protein
MYVIGRTIVGADWDGRYDRNVKERAAQFDYQDMKEGQELRAAGKDPYRSADRSIYFISNVHPCILNLTFSSLMKLEQEQVNLPQQPEQVENECDESAEL